MKLWSKQLKDLELVLIGLQIISIFTLKTKEKNLSHEKTYNKPSLIKKFSDASINASTISDVTGIPVATCIRKLRYLVKIKMIAQDNNSKRYYLIPSATSKELLSKNLTKEVTKVFSEFYFICLRAIISRT